MTFNPEEGTYKALDPVHTEYNYNIDLRKNIRDKTFDKTISHFHLIVNLDEEVFHEILGILRKRGLI